jgi:hypothetical protein
MSEPKPFASLSSGLLARKGTAKPAMRPQGFGKMGSSIDDLGWNDMGHNRPEDEPSPFEAPHDEHVPSPISALTPMSAGFEDDEDFEPSPPVVEQQRAAIEARFGEAPDSGFALATKAKKNVEDVLELNGFEPEASEPEAYEPETYQSEGYEPETYEPAAAQAPIVPEVVEPIVEAQAVPEISEPVVEATIEPEPQPTSRALEPRQSVEQRPVSRAAARAKAAFTLRLDGDRHLKLRLACAMSGRSAQQLVTEALDQLLQSRPEVGALAEQVPGKSGKLN